MEKVHKRLNEFTKKVMHDAELHSPSADFLTNVMAEVSKEKVPAKVYKPLITKVGWFIISSLLLLFAFVLTRFSLGFSILGDWNLSSLIVEKYNVQLSIPSTYTYCFVFLLIFVLIQVYLFSKRFSKDLHR